MADNLPRTKQWLLTPVVKRKHQMMVELGYTTIQLADIWDYILQFRWKKKMPQTIALMKEDIEMITPNDYFDYQQWKALTTRKFDELDYL